MSLNVYSLGAETTPPSQGDPNFQLLHCPAPICEAKSIRRPFVTSNRCRIQALKEAHAAPVKHNKISPG